jgi:hypothetical protein
MGCERRASHGNLGANCALVLAVTDQSSYSCAVRYSAGCKYARPLNCAPCASNWTPCSNATTPLKHNSRSASEASKVFIALSSTPWTWAVASSNSSTAPAGPLSDYRHVLTNTACFTHAGIDPLGRTIRQLPPVRRNSGSSSTARSCAPVSQSSSSRRWTRQAPTTAQA